MENNLKEIIVPLWVHQRSDLPVALKYLIGVIFTLIKAKGKDDNNHKELEISISQLSNLTGCEPLKISRLLKELRKENLIEIDRPSLRRANRFRLHRKLF